MAAASACNGHRVAPSPSLRSTLIDMDIRSLESKLQLLNAQRQLSALRCESFIQMIESEIGRGSAPRAAPSRRASFDLGSGGRSAPARHSSWEEDLSFYYESSASSGSSTSSRRRSNSGATPPPSRRHSSATASRKALRRHSSLTTSDAAAF